MYIKLINNLKFNFGMGYTMSPFGDFIDENILKCARNIPTVKMLPVQLLSPLDLSNNRILVMTIDSVREIERLWG